MDDVSSLMELTGLTGGIEPVDLSLEPDVWGRLDSLTKPPRSLGRLEEVAVRVACVQGTLRPDVSAKRLIVAAGDHGVVAEGVSPYPQDVTWQMVANIARGGAAINQVAESVGAQLTIVDVGVASDVSGIDGVVVEKVLSATRNMCEGPAMTEPEAARACLVGARLSREAVSCGSQLIGIGEMGIGNTTAASALTGAYTGAPVSEVVGPGTGLDAAGVAHKCDVVARALHVNEGALADPLGTLSALGGLEIACLAGVVLGGAKESTCVVIDGFIASCAALAAVRICPAARGYVFASHRSSEPGHDVVLEALDEVPLLDLGMRLGEGTGAAIAMGIIDSACRVLSGMATFDEAGVATKDDGDR